MDAGMGMRRRVWEQGRGEGVGVRWVLGAGTRDECVGRLQVQSPAVYHPPVPARPAEGGEGSSGHVAGPGEDGQQSLHERGARPVGRQGMAKQKIQKQTTCRTANNPYT